MRLPTCNSDELWVRNNWNVQVQVCQHIILASNAIQILISSLVVQALIDVSFSSCVVVFVMIFSL